MGDLVLSLFPGIGLLDMAFEAEGFCVVRGPDLLWGGDVHRFHPPAGRFDGVIGGPPCQRFSRLAALVRHNGYTLAPDLIPEFERIVAEAQPRWALMENVKAAPEPCVFGYETTSVFWNNRWCPEEEGGALGSVQNRERRFSFMTPEGLVLAPERAPEQDEVRQAVLASGSGRPVPVARGGSGNVKRTKAPTVCASGTVWRDGRPYGDKSTAYLKDAIKLQGLPEGFDLPGMTVVGKAKAVGNGVPIPLGRVMARAVRRALGAVRPTS